MTTCLALIGLLAGPFLQLISHQYGVNDGLPERAIHRVMLHQGEVYAKAGACYKMVGEAWVEADDCPAALRGDPEVVPAVPFPARFYLRQPPPNTDAKAQAVAVDDAGHRWIGTDQGIVVTAGDDYLFSIAPEPGGLPYHDVTAIALSEGSEAVWVGFSEGAALRREGTWRYSKGV